MWRKGDSFFFFFFIVVGFVIHWNESAMGLHVFPSPIPEKGTLVYCWWDCKFVQSCWKTAWCFLSKLKIKLQYDPAISFMGIYSKKTITKKKQFKKIYTPKCLLSLIYNSQYMEMSWVSIVWWMNNEGVVNIHNGVLAIEKWKFAIWGQHGCNEYIILNGISQRRQISHDLIVKWIVKYKTKN